MTSQGGQVWDVQTANLLLTNLFIPFLLLGVSLTLESCDARFVPVNAIPF